MNQLLRRILFLPPQASSMARYIDYLHYSIIIITMLGSCVVAGTAVYFAVHYRAGAKRGSLEPDRRPHHTEGGTPLWFEASMILFLLALFVGWWVIGFNQYVKLETPPPGALTIHVIAKQWMWAFTYENGGSSNSVVYVPVGRPVKLVMTSRDVIHSFYVPPFRVKQDVLPGQTTSIWFKVKKPGTYPIYCAEYCGTDHSTMRGKVVALPEEEYSSRTERMPRVTLPGPTSQQPDELPHPEKQAVTLAAMGEQVAARHGCLRCHTVDGTPHIGPTWARMYDSDVPLANGRHVTADEAYITQSMMDPAVKVHRGFPPVMPTYQGQLDAAEVGAIVEFIRSLRDVPISAPTAPLAPSGAPDIALPQQPPRLPREAAGETK